MKQTIKICALWVLVLVLAILPVVTLIAGAYMNGYGALGWALNIAVALVFVAAVIVTLGKSVNAIKFFLIETLAGSVATMFTIGIMSAFCSQMNWYNPQPTAWAIAYVTSTITFAMFVMGEWRHGNNTQKYLFWCGLGIIGTIAVWSIAFCLVNLFGAEMPKLCEYICGTTLWLAFFIAAVRLTVYGVSKAIENGMCLSARCFNGFTALFSASFATLITYVGIDSCGISLPNEILNACGYIMGGSAIGAILSIGVAAIECYIDNRKAKRSRC